MRSHFAIFAAAVALALAAFASPASADDDLRATIRDEISNWSAAQDDNTFKVYWKNGLRMDAKNVQMKIGGELMIDQYFVDNDDFVTSGVPDAAFQSGAELRRARLENAGTLYGHVEWKLSVEFGNPNNPTLVDGYIGLVNMDDCLGCLMPNIRVGYQKVPFGLEQQTPLKFNTFMNRSSATETFTPNRQFGIMIHDVFRGGQLGYAFGYFGADQTFASDGELEWDEGYGLAGRIWYTPWYDCACSCRRLHIGGGGIYVDDISSVRLSNSGPFRVGTTPSIVDTGTLAATDAFVWNIELALVYGPWSVQGEYFSASPNGSGDPTFTGWYAQLSYWLTGECRSYATGAFGRTSPCCNFLDNDCCCKGGIELAGRYSSVDLTDGAIAGGELTDWVIGVNWHLNPNARIMLNYMSANVDNGGPFQIRDQDITGLGLRFQVDW